MEKALEREKLNRAQIENAAKSKDPAPSTAGSHVEAGPEASRAHTPQTVVADTWELLTSISSEPGSTLYNEWSESEATESEP